MPLSLSVKPGDRIVVGDQKIEIVEIEPTVRVRVRAPSGKIVTVTDRADVEVLPKVMLGLGKIQASAIAKLVFIAPKELRILRESLLLGDDDLPSIKGGDAL